MYFYLIYLSTFFYILILRGWLEVILFVTPSFSAGSTFYIQLLFILDSLLSLMVFLILKSLIFIPKFLEPVLSQSWLCL